MPFSLSLITYKEHPEDPYLSRADVFPPDPQNMPERSRQDALLLAQEALQWWALGAHINLFRLSAELWSSLF